MKRIIVIRRLQGALSFWPILYASGNARVMVGWHPVLVLRTCFPSIHIHSDCRVFFDIGDKVQVWIASTDQRSFYFVKDIKVGTSSTEILMRSP